MDELSSWLPSLVFMYSFIMATVNQIKTENQIFNATTGNKTVFIIATALIFCFVLGYYLNSVQTF